MNARTKSDRKKQQKDKLQKKVAMPEAASMPEAAAAPAKVSAPAPKPVTAKAKLSAPAPKPVPEKAKVSSLAPAPQNGRKQAAMPATPAAMAKPQPQAIESAVETIEQSFKAAGQGAVAVNRKLIDIARANLTSGLDLAKDLAKAKTPMEFARLQMSFWEGRMKALATQSEELRALSAELVARANEPIRAHVRRSLTAKAA